MKLKTKIELTIGYAILAALPVMLTLHACKRSTHLYEAKMAHLCNNER